MRIETAIKERLCKSIDELGLDAVVAFSKENIAYGIGYMIQSQSLGLRDRQFALVVSRDGASALLLSANEAEEAASRSLVTDLRPYDEFAEDPMGILADAITDLGASSGKIGIEMDAMPADRYLGLKGLLPRAQLVAGSRVFQQARMVKTPMEIDRLRAAARIGDLAQLEAHQQVREGMTEQDLYRVIVDRALANGAERVLLVQVAAGERSVLSNPAPTERTLQHGDIVKIDTFVTVGGYVCDTGRSFVVGEATDRERDIWRRMQDTLQRLHETLRPGRRANEVWDSFVQIFQEHGLEPAIGFLGHGLGLSLHEEPYIAPHSTTVLEEGMVLAVEPIYRTGDLGFHLEDNLIITSSGVENMTFRIGPDLVVAG